MRLELEEWSMRSLPIANPQTFLEFLLRPQAKHFKKIELTNCNWSISTTYSQIVNEAHDFFLNWKVNIYKVC